MNRWLLGALVCIGVMGAVLTHRIYSEYIFEDSYITYRYALNLAEGRGFTFTPGERVFGTTTPLYTLLLALARLGGADIPAAGSFLHAALTGAVAVLGGLVLRRFGAPSAAVVFAVLAVTGYADLAQFWGMETPLALALILGSMLSVLHRRDTTAAVLVALAFLTRYDAALFAIVLFATLAVRDRSVPWRPGCIALGIVLPWLAFAWIYFGSPLPNTLQAKVAETSAAKYVYHSLTRHVATAWDGLLCILGPGDRARGLEIGLTLAVASGVAIAVRRRFRGEPLLSILLIHPALLWVGYAVIAPPPNFLWYLVPALYGLLLLALLGWSVVFGRLPAPAVRAFLVVVAASFALARYPATATRRLDTVTSSLGYVRRIEAYEDLSDWVLENRLQDLTYMTLEPGYFTYRTGNPAIDLAGLVTKGVYFHGPRERRTTPEELVRVHRPGLLLGSVPHAPEGYVCVRSAFPGHMLLMERGELKARAEILNRNFESSVRSDPGPAPLRHPFHLDVGRGMVSEWRALGGLLGGARIGNALTWNGRPVRDPHILDVLPRTGSQTPEFFIDFDRLEFRFAGTDPEFTLAQLVVDGQVMFTAGGTVAEGPRAFASFTWPVHSWRGHRGRLRFVQAGADHGWVAADHFVSVVDDDRLVVEDFESPDRYADRWSRTFGAGRTRLSTLVGEYGLSILTSAYAATSHGLEGGGELVSRPFTIERDRLSFVVFDFGSSVTELVVDGAVVQRYEGSARRRLTPVTWDVTKSRGAEAVLRVLDRETSRDGWTGIDEIVQYGSGR